MGGAHRTYACIHISEVEIPFTTIVENQYDRFVAMQS